ncbi:hypothetical protein CF086_17415 [Clostridium botulinum]|uniref:hypothetical protein n=1 Tax=Clostridium botulinum TaxID=1491 RepID=UPI000773AA86|nr:hypothetical protein [Clostridium botulinum]MBN3352077.1 hypothetical protein [Clostridium botulinum]
MNKQIMMFLKYFLTIEDGSNEQIPNSKIDSIIFNPRFHKALIKQQYLKKNENIFRGYPFEIDYNEGADYWGMMLSSKEENK